MANQINKTGIDNNFLLGRLKEGDRKVFTLLFDYYYSGLVIYADKFVEDTDVSEDIVQSAFIRLWENKHNIKSESVRYYLINSVKNSCIDTIRKKETKEKYLSRQKSRGVEYNYDFWAESELKEMIERAVEKLPDRCKEIFKMSRFEGYKTNEISKKLNISPRTVETQISKALKILRLELKDYLFHLLFF